MALNFPNSPTNGQIYTDALSGNSWTYDSANTCWKSTSTYIQTITVSSSAPGTPAIGQLWWNRDYGRLLVYYSDGDSSQWVDASPSDYTSALAFNKANNALANTTSTFAGDLTITGNTSIKSTQYMPPDSCLLLGSNTKIEISNPGQRRIYSLGATSSNYQLNVSGGAAVLFDRISGSDELAFETHYTGNSHAERMRITKEGYVKTPYQPFFTGFASDGAGWRNFNTVTTLIKMTNLTVNQGSYYNSSTGLFTCPVAGIYKVTVWALMGQAGGSNYVYVFKNGSGAAGAGAHVNTNGTSLWVSSGITAFVSCAVNDTLAMYGYTDNHAGLYTSDSHTGMTIELAG